MFCPADSGHLKLSLIICAWITLREEPLKAKFMIVIAALVLSATSVYAQERVTIVSAASGMCLDVPNANLDDNIPINQFGCDGSLEQTFILEDRNDGFANIIASHSGKCLEVPGGRVQPNLQIVQRSCNDTREQGFLLR